MKSFINKRYKGEVGTLSTVAYQWIDEGKGAYCAWCGIARKSVLNQQLHMDTHTKAYLVDESKFVVMKKEIK